MILGITTDNNKHLPLPTLLSTEENATRVVLDVDLGLQENDAVRGGDG